ncbi:MAG TPA: deoxyribonuclease IV [Methanomicrobiales archaeon]|nr:deoxyribonuclease IV [Methanomicrobiales archaeon]
MVTVGVHVSIAKSIDLAVDRAKEIGCDTFQIFSRSPRGWSYKDLTEEQVKAFREKLKASSISPAVDHMPYLPNLASPKGEHYRRSVGTLKVELHRSGQLGIPYLVTHLGHYRDEGKEGGYAGVIGAVNEAFSSVKNDVMLLLETTAGERNTVGGTFEDIRRIIDGIEGQERAGVCFDTCHTFVAGYELRTPEGIRQTLDHFDEIIGIPRLKVVHLNDARGEFGSHWDRHEHIGMGTIGEEGFRNILHHPVLSRLPLICETPVDGRRDDRGNILKVRELAGEAGPAAMGKGQRAGGLANPAGFYSARGRSRRTPGAAKGRRS